MPDRTHRRRFVRDAALATAATLAAGFAASSQAAEPSAPVPAPGSSLPLMPAARNTLPRGRIGKHEFSRLMLGGNLISGYAHSRDLHYVAQLMRRYNTEARILETLELAEIHGINAINLAICDDLSFLQKHWKRGGKMKLIAQALIEENGGLSQFQKAVDLGASAVHLQGHGSERLVHEGSVDLIGKAMDFLKSRGVAAGVGAHALAVIQECEKARLPVDFYQKTLHTKDYVFSQDWSERDEVSRGDNSWCHDAEDTVDFMWSVKKPWVAFKVMAAGAIPPLRAFPYAYHSGADFILAGMFDWQIEEDVKIANAAWNTRRRTRPMPV